MSYRMHQDFQLPKSNRGVCFILVLLSVVAFLSLPANAAPKRQKTYKIQANDTLPDIADRFYVAVNHIVEINKRLKKNPQLVAGNALRIPAKISKKQNRIHSVEPGDSLGSLSTKYLVSPKAISRANHLPKGVDLFVGQELIIPVEDAHNNPVYTPQSLRTVIKSGKRTKNGVIHTVQPGQTLSVLSEAYSVPLVKIAFANTIAQDAILAPRQKIVIPGAKEIPLIPATGRAYQDIHFIRTKNGRELTFPLLTATGEVNKKSRRLLSILAGVTGWHKPRKLLDKRLIVRLQQVADKFHGRTIDVVSGWRPRAKGVRRSMHNRGRALDFHVSGISRKRLYRFIKKLPKVGAGFYPNILFVHMDVRQHALSWVDVSRSGERSMYRRVSLSKNTKNRRNNAQLKFVPSETMWY